MQARAAGHIGPFDDSVAVLREHFDALRQQSAAAKPAPARAGRKSKVSYQEAREEIAMTRVLVLVLLLALCATVRAEVSFVNEGVVDGPIEEVWKVFATSEGYKVLGPALAEVDLRLGRHDSLEIPQRRHPRRRRDDREHDPRV